MRNSSSEELAKILGTTKPGVLAEGDVPSESIKRVASGVAEGSTAVQFVHKYITEM